MYKRRVELLSPVGSYDALVGVLNAGADAVYLAGREYGARAYAENLSNEELVSAIRLCHIFNVRVYLTVNTLLKESELSSLHDFLRPLCDAGLDGVIVQDIGVMRYINREFPRLNIHASTQMSVTGAYGARLLKKYNVTRIVPARELSLNEIKAIKEEADIEVETFIHGAMCYCYSGQCLLSSLLGGRSGNRGRCSQPCRLPYKSKENGIYKDTYLLSMKDMYTLKLIPELISAGIDSFKIEGRMKKPEYAAGVTHIYRKYIDRYYSGETYETEKEDEALLKNLYIRNDTSEGYFYRHNAASMLTFTSPAYNGASDEVLKEITDRFINKAPKREISAEVYIKKGERAALKLTADNIRVEYTGDTVSEAKNAPLSEGSIRERISKTGETPFEIKTLRVITDGKSFMPVKELNALRREAVSALEEEILKSYE